MFFFDNVRFIISKYYKSKNTDLYFKKHIKDIILKNIDDTNIINIF